MAVEDLEHRAGLLVAGVLTAGAVALALPDAGPPARDELHIAAGPARPWSPPGPTSDPVASPQLLESLRRVALGAPPEALTALPLAPRVQLWLGTTVSTDVAAAALAEREAWRVPLPDRLYAGYATVPTALELLAREPVGGVVLGPHPHCAGAARPAPPGLEDATRVSTQAQRPRSCLDWWTVDVFVRGGHVVAVSLDLWEP